MKNIGKELSLINDFLALGCHPGHFSLSLHLRIYETSDVMATIRPFKLSVALNLGIFEVTTVDKVFFRFYLFVWKVGLLVVLDAFPLFVALSIDKVAAIKEALNLDGAVVGAFGSLASHLVLLPGSFILRLI
jgi:hypothetical protein